MLGNIFKSSNLLRQAVHERKWAFSLTAGSLICVLLIVASYNAGLVSSSLSIKSIFSLFPSQAPPPPPQDDSSLARFSYLIAGIKGESDRLWRALRVVYHPLNHYVIHIETSEKEISEFANRLANDPVYSRVGNVIMMRKADRITYNGPTMIANTLHAAAILLRENRKWDWFVNFSPADYPLVTQDDLIYAFSSLQRNLTFIDNTKQLGWKEWGRGKTVIIDPGLYMKNKTNIITAQEKREVPDAFKLYTGSAWFVLSRPFVEFCIWGWDNLPRTLLMYHANFVTATEFYFQTVICNAVDFVTTVVNHDMHYIVWDHPPKQHPVTLTLDYLDKMIASNAPFARKFLANDPVLDRIDKQYLGRNNSNGFTYGGWCSGNPPCSEVGNMTYLVPGTGAKRLRNLMDGVLTSYENKCNSTHEFV